MKREGLAEKASAATRSKKTVQTKRARESHLYYFSLNNRWKQHKCIPREEATSTTVTTYSIFKATTTEAHEVSDLAIIELPGACLNSENDDVVTII